LLSLRSASPLLVDGRSGPWWWRPAAGGLDVCGVSGVLRSTECVALGCWLLEVWMVVPCEPGRNERYAYLSNGGLVVASARGACWLGLSAVAGSLFPSWTAV